ncbi:MAG: RNA-binding S4 domain-containing protein [Prevotellaceae bacterium]|jgi:ribosome-associated heat shock protein Hsp15|nr:RNA-binding S4 domain-containing protein [Prevotellaceae bacterium]
MEDVRIDKWLWAMRIYKTRSEAADACKHGKVIINNVECKPSRMIKKGETIIVRKLSVIYTYRVVDITENRQSAKNVAQYVENLTPQEEMAKLNAKNITIFVHRDKGSGRPTKKERRMLDNIMNEFTE